MPYLRDMLVRLGVFTDTFESAVTWERFPAFHAAVTRAVEEALGEPCRVTCRLTHVYPDGPAPYFTVLAPARRGDEVAQWHEMKQAAGRAILDAGGTITHHHGVGRDHRPWYDAPAPRRVRGRATRRQARARPRRAAQPRRADRSVADSGSVSRRTRGSASGGSSGSGPWGPGVSARGPWRSKSAS